MLLSLFAGAEIPPPPLLSEGGGTLESIRQRLKSVGSVRGQRHGLPPSPPPPPRPAMDDANSCRNHKTLSDYKHNESVTYHQQLSSGAGASRVILAAVFIPLSILYLRIYQPCCFGFLQFCIFYSPSSGLRGLSRSYVFLLAV